MLSFFFEHQTSLVLNKGCIRIKKCHKQAGAELCQAQYNLSLLQNSLALAGLITTNLASCDWSCSLLFWGGVGGADGLRLFLIQPVELGKFTPLLEMVEIYLGD